MMLLLGLVDILAALALLSRILGVNVPLEAVIVIPVALFFKSLINIFDPGSITDLIVAVLIVLSSFLTLPWWLLLIPALAILLKGILSFIHL